VDDLAHCVSDQKRLVTEVEDAYMLIKTRHQDNVVVGIDRLANTINRMPKYLSSCPKSKPHVAQLQQWSKTYSKNVVAENFLAKDSQMSVEFAKANFEFKNYLHWEFGEELGSILRILNSH
jgi:hypothetical protein